MAFELGVPLGTTDQRAQTLNFSSSNEKGKGKRNKSQVSHEKVFSLDAWRC